MSTFSVTYIYGGTKRTETIRATSHNRTSHPGFLTFFQGDTERARFPNGQVVDLKKEGGA
jgi:hypothetical protein